MIEAREVAILLGTGRFPLSFEKATQGEVEKFLRDHLPVGVSVAREFRLSPEDVPDFLIDEGIVVEVKLKSARKMAVWKQLERYAADARVRELILLTNLSMGLPPMCGEKPVYFVSLGKAWL